MALWFAALLGLLQGLTEFIPVSSTAHLRIAPALFGQPDPGAPYTAVLQLGTLVAVLAYFAKDLVALPVAMFKDPSSADGRLPWLIAAGTVPIVIAGLVLKKHIEGDLRSLYVVCGTLIGVGLILIVIDRYAAGRGATKPIAAGPNSTSCCCQCNGCCTEARLPILRRCWAGCIRLTWRK